MARYVSLRELDWTLTGIVLALCTLGVLQIYSATRATVWQGVYYRQVIYVLAGLALMWLMAQVDYHLLLDRVPMLYLLSLLGLLLVFVIGEVRFGARRWIPVLWGFNFQVSEFVKLVLVLLVARYFSEVRGDSVSGPDMLKIGGLVGIPMLLVMRQPDLGTALSYVPIAGAGILGAGVRWKYLAILAAVLILILPAGWHFLKPYQKERLLTFVEPARDPQGSGY